MGIMKPYLQEKYLSRDHGLLQIYGTLSLTVIRELNSQIIIVQVLFMTMMIQHMSF